MKISEIECQTCIKEDATVWLFMHNGHTLQIDYEPKFNFFFLYKDGEDHWSNMCKKFEPMLDIVVEYFKQKDKKEYVWQVNFIPKTP